MKIICQQLGEDWQERAEAGGEVVSGERTPQARRNAKQSSKKSVKVKTAFFFFFYLLEARSKGEKKESKSPLRFWA